MNAQSTQVTASRRRNRDRRCPIPPRGIVRCLLAALAAVALNTDAHAKVLLNGSGSTFAFPLYSKWAEAFHQRDPDIRVNYASIGSGAGIANVAAGTTDFGASDGPMPDDQLRDLSVPILHFPTALGAVVVTFNVNHIDRLRLDPQTIADIFLGKITNWKDPAFRRNTTMPLPDAPITVVHRSDLSGTTYIFTDYLSKVSAEWQTTVGRGTTVTWPVGLMAQGNEGVADLVQHTENSIGFVELSYSEQHDLPYAGVLNRAGQYVLPSVESVRAAGTAAATHMPQDFRVSITNGDGPDAYPIASFTWLLVPAHFSDARRGVAMRHFLKWMLADGQALAPSLRYAPLPTKVVALERHAIAGVQVDAEDRSGSAGVGCAGQLLAAPRHVSAMFPPES
jgi:phosphate transport system substrate-binding protein